MTDGLQELLYRRFEERQPDLLRSAIADKQVCLELFRRMDDPDKFGLALFVLEYYWQPDASVIERCRQLIGDKMVHEDYRASAMNYLVTVNEGTEDPATVAALVSIVRDEVQVESLRMIAYFGFLRVIDYSRPLCSILFSRIPETTRDINWRLVRKWSRDCQEQQ